MDKAKQSTTDTDSAQNPLLHKGFHMWATNFGDAVGSSLTRFRDGY